MSSTKPRSGRRSESATAGPRSVANSAHDPIAVATPREAIVANAAPSIPYPANPVAANNVASRATGSSAAAPGSAAIQPNSGLASNPKIRNGSSTTFNTTETNITAIGVRVSPYPRISAEKTKKPNISGIPRKITSM